MKVFHFVPFYLCITVKLFEAMGIEVDDSLPLRLVLKYRNDFGKYSPARTRIDYRHDGVTLVDTLASNSKSVSTKQRIARIEVQRSELEVLLREIIADDDVEDLEEVSTSFDDCLSLKQKIPQLSSRHLENRIT